MNATDLKPGDKVTYPGIAKTEWMPIREEGYKATVRKIFKNGKVQIEVEPARGIHWLRDSSRNGCFNVDPARLTPRLDS